MSEEETEDLSQKYDTKPTIETVLKRIDTLEQGVNARMTTFEQKMEDRLTTFEQGIDARATTFEQKIDARMEKMEEHLDVRLDRIESEVKATHSELFTLRADFKELRSAFNDFRRQPTQPA
jgi:tetrahydromethanopterin S-methyltransferase subunit G